MTPTPDNPPNDLPETEPVNVPDQNASIPFLMLADRAEVLLGKLYVMGGLFSTFATLVEPASLTFALALAVDVPWNAANEQADLAIIFEDIDGVEVARVAFGMMVGRPPHLKRGAVQRVPFALPTLTLVVPKAGEYIARSTINGTSGPRVQFNVQKLG